MIHSTRPRTRKATEMKLTFAACMNFDGEDDADAIPIIDNGQLTIDNEAGTWYDLSGRKMVNGKWSNGKLPKGIYIHNGRKEVLK